MIKKNVLKVGLQENTSSYWVIDTQHKYEVIKTEQQGAMHDYTYSRYVI